MSSVPPPTGRESVSGSSETSFRLRSVSFLRIALLYQKALYWSLQCTHTPPCRNRFLTLSPGAVTQAYDQTPICDVVGTIPTVPLRPRDSSWLKTMDPFLSSGLEPGPECNDEPLFTDRDTHAAAHAIVEWILRAGTAHKDFRQIRVDERQSRVFGRGRH